MRVGSWLTRGLIAPLTMVLACAAPVLDDDDGDDAADDDDVGQVESAATTGTAGWRVTFRDEFNGTSLDRTKWETKYKWGQRSLPQHNEQQCYLDENVSVANGRLVIKAEKRTVTCDGRTVGYASGMISAHKGMQQLYGYFEMRARVPKGKGFWPAFWTLPNQGSVRAEIDIVETLGHQPNRAYMNVHWADSAGANQGLSTAYVGPDFTAGFHTYAAQWKKNVIVWYVDGVERKRFTTALAEGSYIPYEPMYLIANLAVGGNWPGNPDATTPLPSSLVIDHVRAITMTNIGGANPNRVTNASFESGATGWRLYGGARLASAARTGSRAIRVEGQGGVEQVVTGLAPFTLYRLTGYVRALNGSTSGLVGVKEYGGAHQLQAWGAGSAYTKLDVTFMTGNTTTAKIFFYQPTGTNLVDDMSLRVLH